MEGMGGSEKYTLSVDHDDIIHLVITGGVDRQLALEILAELNGLVARLHGQGKNILLSVDLAKAGVITGEARRIARGFLKEGDYDRVAIIGADNSINMQARKYLLNSVVRTFRLKFFQTEPEAKRWLRRGQSPIKRKARRALAFGLAFAALAVFWHFVVAPLSFRLPDDFSYTASVVSRDNFYDENTGAFGGETISNTRFGYQAEASKNGVLQIKNIFDVRTSSGDKIFAVERTYGIDKKTRQHVPGHGDRDRKGYLFGPVGADKGDFTYWHINYDAPATMKFQNEENILGLKTYHYVANYHADQTADLSHLPGVGKTRGVNLDISLQLWIEPTTGYLVKYEDNTTAYYYDLATRQRINPWNKFSNSYSFESITAHVQTADQLRERKLSNEGNSPIFYGLIAAIFFIRWLRLLWRIKIGKIDDYSAFSRIFVVLAVLAGMLVLTLSAWQQTIEETDKQENIRFQDDAHSLHDTITGELSSYIQAVEAARGLFAASVEVDRSEWNAYVNSLGLVQNYPGMHGLAFVQPITAAQKNAHIAKVRAEGYPDYTIHPEGARSNYASMVYFEPFNRANEPAFGYDLLTNAGMRPAMEAARDSGETAISGRVLHVQDSAADQEYGLSIFAPVFAKDMPLGTVEQRRAALTGYVYAPFHLDELVRPALIQQTSGLNIEVFDAAEVGKQTVDNRLYDFDERAGLNSRSYQPAFVRLETMQVAGHTFVIRYASLPEHRQDLTLQALPGFILFVGLLLSGLITAIVFLQSSARSRALKLAEKMTNDLRTERNMAVTIQHKDEAILSSIGDGVFVIDQNGLITMFNKAAELISGYTADEAFGRHYKGVLHFQNEEDGKLVEGFIITALSGKRAEMATHTMLKRKNGTTVPVADSAAPIMNAQGTIEGAVVVFRDTTRERQLEHMKDEFLSVASHELRTPMGAVRANITMILGGDYGPVNKELVEPLEDMKQSTVRLVELVNDLLDVARIEAGRTRFVLSDFKLHEVAKETVASLAPLGKERGIPVELEVSAEAEVQGDIDKIRQVLTNLIGNSLKFTAQGSIKVTLTTSDGMAEVSVADTGLGISPDDQKKLFTKFKQITSAQDGKPAGTGLGLYISRELIRKMGGELRIKSSEIGKGSVFAFTLPRAGTPAADRAKQTIEHEAELHPDQK